MGGCGWGCGGVGVGGCMCVSRDCQIRNPYILNLMLSKVSRLMF